MIDFSILKNIDLTNKDTLLFLAIFSVIAIVVFLICLFVIAAIIKATKRIIIQIFNFDVKKPKFNQRDAGWLHRKKESEKDNFTPKARIPENNPADAFKPVESRGEKEQDVKSYKEKEEQSIPESLGKLKGEMQEDDKRQKIDVPTPKRFQKNPAVGYGQSIITANQKPGSNIDENWQEIKTPTSRRPVGGHGYQSGGSDFAGPDFGTSISELKQKEAKPVAPDSSMFGGKSEISRRSLEHELRYDPKVWKAQREVGLNLSPAERAKLVRETFSPVYGQNISKSDLRFSIDKLNRKLIGTKNPAEHAKIRKEIKLFKKIGGIK